MERPHYIKSFLKLCLLIPILFFSHKTLQAGDDDLVLDDGKEFYVDAVVFRSDSLLTLAQTGGRLDVFLIVPYQTLNFIHSDNLYASKFKIVVTITTQNAEKIAEKTIEKNLKANSYFEAQGGNGKFDFSQMVFNLNPGEYKVKSTLIDEFQNVNYESSRNISVIDYSKYDLSLSGLLLLSSIEEKNSKFKITPHISDNIGSLKDGYFLFFEVYKQNDNQNVSLAYQILNDKDEIIFKSKLQIKEYKAGKTQDFIRVPKLEELTVGSYKVKLILLNSVANEEYQESDYLAVSQRSLKYSETISGYVINDIDASIRQLNYIASNEELKFINDSKNANDKRKRFEQFWKEKDPSPNSDYNEAFIEFYSRISYCNKNFRAFTEGWLSDRARVYVVLGEPLTKEQQYSSGNGAYYETWTYANNRQFVFVDSNGFGEFRLVRPISFLDKYQYIK